MKISPEFGILLDKLSEQLGGKPKSQIIEEAVRVFASSARSEIADKNIVADIIDKLDGLSNNDNALKQAILDNQTLLLQILKNQQN